MKRLFKGKTVIILLTSVFLINNSYSFDLNGMKEKTYTFITKDMPNFMSKNVPDFLTTKTNPILKPTPGIISTAENMMSSINSKIQILTKTQNQIPQYIKAINKSSQDIIDLSDNTQSLMGVQECISQYKTDSNNLINFIKENSKTITKIIKSLWGLKTDTIETSEYPIHDTIAKNGLTAGSAEYLVEITKKQSQNLNTFENCVANVPGNKKITEAAWFKKLIEDKNLINKQTTSAIKENLKYHIRSILETVTPENPYLKWALISALVLASIEATYIFGYGITKNNLRQGIKNTAAFNWKLAKFLPYTMPKYLLNYLLIKPVKYINQKVQGNGNLAVNINLNGPGNAKN